MSDAARRFVFAVPEDQVPEVADLDGLEVLVTIWPGTDPPEVALRPTIAGAALRVWGPPLECTRRDP